MEPGDPATPQDGIPDYLTEALQTSEACGYKLFDDVLDHVVENQPGFDRPVVRQAIASYIDRGMIEEIKKKTGHFLRDKTKQYPPRISQGLYEFWRVVRPHVSNEFTALPFEEIRNAVENPSNTYARMGELVEHGFVENEAPRSGKYRLGTQTHAGLYADGQYQNGRLVNMRTLETIETEPHTMNQEIPHNSPVPNASHHASTIENMIRAIQGLEGRVETSRSLAQQIDGMRTTLQRAGKTEDQITPLLQALRTELETFGNVTQLTEELAILKASLPLWQQYLGEEKIG